ncbi:hypothetical protein AAE485_07905 [Acidithiobacillus ferriphilus]|uniref:hypothetical protein n=1 Tax=Acidithiobacillus ferriphilus TaxID=1689834 RepID=UPI00390CBDB7
MRYLKRAVPVAIAISAIYGYFSDSAIAATSNIPSPIQIIKASRLINHGYNGQGINVGIISNGIANYNILSRSGLLPKDVRFYGNMPGSGDEGDWMMQVIHDIAPGAKLGFCTPVASSSIGASGIVECEKLLAEKFHANIITDDLNAKPQFWSPTPKTMLSGKLLNKFKNLLLISGVGNFGGGYYEGAWEPTPFLLAGKSYPAQDFGKSVGQGSRPYDSFIMPSHTGVNIFLGINSSPEASSRSCPSSNPKITLALLNGHNEVLASQTQRCALFKLTYFNSNPSAIIARIVVLKDSTEPSDQSLAIKMLAQWAERSATRSVPLRYNTLGGASNSGFLGPRSIIVAAVDPNTYLRNHLAIEPFATSGPLRLNYGINSSGGGLVRFSSPQIIDVPDVVIPDRFMVAMPLFGGAGYVMRPFIGDSAAGPAAAGVAALLLSAHVPADQISELLKKSAYPQVRAGWNSRYGYGLIDADKAAVMAGVLPEERNPSAAHRENAPASPIHRFRPSPAFLHEQTLAMAAIHGNTISLTEIQKAADAGDEGGRFWLAVYDQKTGHDTEAADLCSSAAHKSEFPPAENCLGTLFYRGLGVHKDYRAAYIWWLRAARAGIPNAAFRVGLLQAKGFGTATNLVDAYALMLTAKTEGLRNPILATTMDKIRNRLSADDQRIAGNMARGYVSDPSSIRRQRNSG